MNWEKIFANAGAAMMTSLVGLVTYESISGGVMAEALAPAIIISALNGLLAMFLEWKSETTTSGMKGTKRSLLLSF